MKNDLVETFTEGDCWVLALEIEKNYGFPIIVITDGFTEDDEGQFETDAGWTHALNLLPDGRFIDIKGIYEGHDGINDLYDIYFGSDIMKVTPQQLLGSVKDAQIQRRSTDEELSEGMKVTMEQIFA